MNLISKQTPSRPRTRKRKSGTRVLPKTRLTISVCLINSWERATDPEVSDNENSNSGEAELAQGQHGNQSVANVAIGLKCYGNLQANRRVEIMSKTI